MDSISPALGFVCHCHSEGHAGNKQFCFTGEETGLRTLEDKCTDHLIQISHHRLGLSVAASGLIAGLSAYLHVLR